MDEQTIAGRNIVIFPQKGIGLSRLRWAVHESIGSQSGGVAVLVSVIIIWFADHSTRRTIFGTRINRGIGHWFLKFEL